MYFLYTILSITVFNRGRFLHLSPLYDVIGQGLGPYWVMGT